MSETNVLGWVLKGGTLTSWPAHEPARLVQLREQQERRTRSRTTAGTLLGPEGAG